MEEPIIYDDYNGRIKADQSTVGTLTTNCGNDAERNGVKIIEPMTTRGGGIVSTLRATIHKQGERNLMENFLNGRGYEGVIEPIALDEQNKCIRHDGTVGTLTTDGSSPKHNNRVIKPAMGGGYRIRKLTPKECWRLMDFDDEDFDQAKAVGISDSQLYRQAGTQSSYRF